MRISHLDHLVLTVADADVTAHWYETVLGMSRVCFAGDRTALHFGKQKINLHSIEQAIEPRAAKPSSGSADLCLIVEGTLEDAIKHFAKHGVPVEVGPITRTGATGPILSVYVRDPDGNLVEISSYEVDGRST